MDCCCVDAGRGTARVSFARPKGESAWPTGAFFTGEVAACTVRRVMRCAICGEMSLGGDIMPLPASDKKKKKKDASKLNISYSCARKHTPEGKQELPCTGGLCHETTMS